MKCSQHGQLKPINNFLVHSLGLGTSFGCADCADQDKVTKNVFVKVKVMCCVETLLLAQ